MKKFLTGLLSLCLMLLGFVTIILAHEDADNMLIFAGWLVVLMGLFRFVMSEVYDV